MISDRFSEIHEKITKWQIHDPELKDKKGFLEYLKSCDIGQFNVGNVSVWMEYYKRAKKKGVSVAEIIFNFRREMLNKRLEVKRDSSKLIPERVFIVDEKKRKELEEMNKRLTKYDPARVKRQSI